MRGMGSCFWMLAVLALCLPVQCWAQMYRPDRLGAIDAGPELNLGLSPSFVHGLNAGAEDDFRALDAFGGGRRGIDRFPRGHAENRGWKFYGRFYLVNFQNEFGAPDAGGTRITWRRTGPGIPKSRIYIAIHRQF